MLHRIKLLPCLVILGTMLGIQPLLADDFYVAPSGNDRNPGTQAAPLATLAHAQQLARAASGLGHPVTVYLRGGIYYLPTAVVFTPADSGKAGAPVTYQAYADEQPVVSGGVKLDLHWTPYRDGIMQASVPEDLKTEEIFVNGERQILARYPNFDANQRIFNGYAADTISPDRVARWADPTGGYFHAMHPSMWGDFSWIITGKDDQGQLGLEGGWQNNRGGGQPHRQYRFVENIFEELDAPGEWFLNLKTHVLYFYPPEGLTLDKATVEAVRLRSLVEFRGDETKPVRFVTLKGLTFRHAARTFMDNKEPLLRSDWTIYRGGAVFFEGTEDCALVDSFLDQLGGNAVFVNNYNRRVTVRGCRIEKSGASGIAFVGDPQAVRSPLFHYEQVQDLAVIDRAPGPKTNNYPADCLVDDCLITLTGRVEKQTAAVEISMAQSITVRHCSIYDVPRAGINIGDGTWGGHIIEYCDIFDTVKETGDHGSFNSWGRDRFWRPNINQVNAVVAQAPDLPLLDAVKPVILRNNRWRCDHGWDIDLDDGSSNYEIYNNLCLHGGIKNREGYHRVVENNIIVGSSFQPHVWFAESGDVVRKNIVWATYQPANMRPPPWGQEMDFNLLYQVGATNGPATALQRRSGRDEHSIVADAMFIDPVHGDYRVQDGSPALALGFKNFPMDQFGVQKPSLKAMAHTPVLPTPAAAVARPAPPTRSAAEQTWLQVKVRNLVGQGEMSAFGAPGETGVIVMDVPAGTALQAADLRKDDLILGLDGKPVSTVDDLVKAKFTTGQSVKLVVLRTQKEQTLSFTAP